MTTFNKYTSWSWKRVADECTSDTALSYIPKSTVGGLVVDNSPGVYTMPPDILGGFFDEPSYKPYVISLAHLANKAYADDVFIKATEEASGENAFVYEFSPNVNVGDSASVGLYTKCFIFGAGYWNGTKSSCMLYFYSFSGEYLYKAKIENISSPFISISSMQIAEVSEDYVIISLLWYENERRYFSLPIVASDYAMSFSVNFATAEYYSMSDALLERPAGLFSYPAYHGKNRFSDGINLYQVTDKSDVYGSGIIRYDSDQFPYNGKDGLYREDITYASLAGVDPYKWRFRYYPGDNTVNKYGDVVKHGKIFDYSETIELPGSISLHSGYTYLDTEAYSIYAGSAGEKLTLIGYDENANPIFADSNVGCVWAKDGEEYTCLNPIGGYNYQSCDFANDYHISNPTYSSTYVNTLASWCVKDEETSVSYSIYMAAQTQRVRTNPGEYPAIYVYYYHLYKLDTAGLEFGSCSCGPITKTAHKTFNRYG